MLSLFNRKTPEKLFLSLVISESTVATALWKASANGQAVLGYSHPASWNSEAEQSLVEASDAALDELGPEVNSVKEVLLGLPESWATGQAIAADKKQLIKKLADQLNLKSVGFVIIPEAIAALFRDRQKTGLNALLVFISQKSVQLLPLLHGQAQEGAKVGRSESLVKDIIEACARGDYSSLPARILLASQDIPEAQLISAQQELQSTEWKEKLFVTHPRVDLVPPQMILDAVSLAGGKEVARALGLSPKEKDTDTDKPQTKEPETFGFKPVGEESTESMEAFPSETSENEDKVNVGVVESVRRPRRFPKVFVYLFGFLLILLLLGGLAYLGVSSTASAQVDVVVKSKSVSFDSSLTIDANASESNTQDNILKATLRTKSVEDTAEAFTTGTKTIGDKAKGVVTLYNRTTVGDKTFKAGTVLKLDSNVQFTTDSDVSVPVGNKDNGYVGKTTVNVTAVNIGAESNIASGTELLVGDFDKASYVATSNADFAGGTSRNVQVVSEADQKKLADSLYAQLKTKALASFNSEVSSEEHVVLSDKVTVSKKIFSDDIGKEVKSFTVDMAVTATAIVFTNQDITTLATAKLASQIPPGSTLKPERTVVEIKDQKPLSDTKTQVNATISSVIIPAFEANQISQELAGKSLTDAQIFLTSLDSISSYSISFSPSFAGSLLRRMPSQNKIVVKSTVE